MKIIWLIGSMGSGKTTQNKNLAMLLSDFAEPEIIRGEENGTNYIFTKVGQVASLGVLKPDVQTCGIDPVYSELKKEGLLKSCWKAWELDCKYLIIEGAQASYEWYKQVILPFYSVLNEKFEESELHFFHLALGYDDNLYRIRERRWKKQNGDNLEGYDPRLLPLEDRTYDNVLGKNKQYRSLFNRLKKELGEEICIELNAMEEPEVITLNILNKIN